jgi:hypothetical protein
MRYFLSSALHCSIIKYLFSEFDFSWAQISGRQTPGLTNAGGEPRIKSAVLRPGLWALYNWKAVSTALDVFYVS